MTDTLWTPEELREYLRVKSSRTFSRVKKMFPRVPGLPLERYDPATVRQIVMGDTPAQKHYAVRTLRRAV